MDNLDLYNKALEAINKLFSDRSVDRLHTITNLEELQGEIQTMLDALDADFAASERQGGKDE